MKYSRIELSTTQRDVLGWGEGIGVEAIHTLTLTVSLVGQLETK